MSLRSLFVADSEVKVLFVDEVTDEVMEAVARLLPQLSSSAGMPERDFLQAISESDATTLLVARLIDVGHQTPSRTGVSSSTEPTLGPIVGMLSLVTFSTPTGTRSWIEDVVVDESARGAGVGEALVRSAVQLAGTLGSRTVDLTSRPSREAANRLYIRAGFELRETNVYRFAL